MPRSDPQVPSANQIFLDHVGWFVSDIAQASLAFEMLGFPLTPYSVHSNLDPTTGVQHPVGSANRLAMLASGYLEILTPVAGVDTPISRHMRTNIARHEGVHLVAFTVSDATGEAVRLADAGFDVMEPVHLRRTIEAENGDQVEVAFTVIRAALGSVPEGRVQTLTHHTPEHMWQGRYVADNGVAKLAYAVVVSSDPGASAARLARYTGRQSRPDHDGETIRLDRGAIRVMSDAQFRVLFGDVALPPHRPSIAALGFCGDPHIFARRLDQQGIAYSMPDGASIVVRPEHACGVALVVESDR